MWNKQLQGRRSEPMQPKQAVLQINLPSRRPAACGTTTCSSTHQASCPKARAGTGTKGPSIIPRCPRTRSGNGGKLLQKNLFNERQEQNGRKVVNVMIVDQMMTQATLTLIQRYSRSNWQGRSSLYKL